MMKVQKRFNYSVCFLILLGSSHCLPTPNSPKTPIVTTDSGDLIGVSETWKDNNLSYFLGIPYAEPPIGRLRFLKPLPVKPWSEVKLATSLPPRCYQQETPIFESRLNKSEDCLYLNIVAPSQAIHQPSTLAIRRPVFLYLHGGAFVFGAGSDDPNLSRALVLTQNIILVTINSRLDVFGYLYQEKVPELVGNQGLWDQNLALKWIKRNIHHFGGDPERITLGGLSSGAKATSAHISSPHAVGLFSNAYLQSGVALHFQERSTTRVGLAGEELLNATGCNNATKKLQCLQSFSSSELINLRSSKRYSFSPIYGDEYLPDTPDEFLASSTPAQIDVNVLFGLLKDDATIFLSRLEPDVVAERNLSLEDGIKILSHFVRDEVICNVSQVYFGACGEGSDERKDIQDTRWALIKFYTDISFSCPTFRFAERYSARQRKGKTFGYYLTFKPTKRSVNLCPNNPYFGVCHADDVPFIFGSPLEDYKSYTHEDLIMSLNMMNILGEFIRAGKPPDQGTIRWPSWSEKNGHAAMVLSPHSLGKLLRSRIEVCKKMYDFFEENLLPKLHVYRKEYYNQFI